jgi:Phosphoesterase family/Lactonase, 7-bladed beta-propeller
MLKPLSMPIARCAACFAFILVSASSAAPLSERVTLPTGQVVQRPHALTFFGRPGDMAMSHDGRVLAVKNSHGVLIVDARRLTLVQTLPLPKPGRDFPEHLGGNGVAGIAWTDDDRGVWQADAYNTLRQARRAANGHFAWTSAVVLDRGGTAAPIGVTLVPHGHTAAVALSADNVLACIDTVRMRVTCRIPVGVAPYASAYVRGRLFVSNWGGRRARRGDATQTSDGTPVVVNSRTGATATGTLSVVAWNARRVIASIQVGLHPGAIIASPDGRFVYVANAQSDSVSEVSTSSLRVTHTFHLSSEGRSLRSPQALAFSPDGRSLWIAESISNDVAKLDVRSGRVVARFATAWYPSAVVCCNSGRVLVSDLKGVGSWARRYQLPVMVGAHRKGGFNAYDYAGTLEAISIKHARLAPPITRSPASRLRGLFHHVIYVIKENHTYDDVYGDMPGGNGDSTLCTFCSVTPNQHALARRFGIFDNVFVNGVLSADGHNWADSGVATDYVERSLSGFARSYPSAGNDPLAYSTAGFIWNRIIAAGLRFRDYGEFVPDVQDYVPPNARWQDFFRDYRDGTQRVAFHVHPAIASLAPYVDEHYPSFSLRIPDQVRASAFIDDLHRFERSGSLPNLMLVALGNDHTAGTDPGFPTPRAFAADNDLALGRMIEALSHSRFWPDTVVFVLEDDAQDGFDHVDGHRTAALVISARNRAASVDHHFYNQASVLRTIEEIFGLRPMTLFDQTAPAFVAPFASTIDARPFTALRNVVPLDRMNPQTGNASVNAQFKDITPPGVLRDALHKTLF